MSQFSNPPLCWDTFDITLAATDDAPVAGAGVHDSMTHHPVKVM